MRIPREVTEEFPEDSTTCPYFGYVDGQMMFACTRREKDKLLMEADREVFSVWPGKYESHVFLIRE